MVVLFPLMIVGTAFAAYYSIDASVAVAVYTDQNPASEEVYARVAYENKADTEMTINNSHLKTINLKAISNGYDFKGWFEGNVEDYQSLDVVEFLTTDSEINVKMTDYEELLAVFEIKTFEVRYSYKAQPLDPTTVHTTPETDDGSATVRTYTFGDALPTLTYAGGEYRFMGCQIIGDQSETIYTTASFDYSEEITLTAVWQEQNKINVTYYGTDNNVLQTVEIYENQHYELDDAITVMTDKSVPVVDGYNYSWQDINGNVITEINTQTTNLDVYLKEEAISYTVNVNTDGASFNGQSTLTTSFTVKDISQLNELGVDSNWSTGYSFHKVTGFTYDQTTYELSDTNSMTNLANAIIAANPRGTDQPLEIDAVITKYFTTFTVSDSITGYTNVNGPVEDVYRYEDLGTSPFAVLIKSGDSTMTIGEMLTLKTSSGYTQLYAYDEDTSSGIEVSFRQLNITIGSSTMYYQNVSLDMTIDELIVQRIAHYTDTQMSETLNIPSIRALFS